MLSYTAGLREQMRFRLHGEQQHDSTRHRPKPRHWLPRLLSLRRAYPQSGRFFHFGLQFYSKYQLSFDPKNKRIYYFGTKEQSNQKNKNDNNSQNNWYRVVLIILIIVVAGIVLLALGMLLQKKLTKLPRKVRANELDDNFLYENQGNINT